MPWDGNWLGRSECCESAEGCCTCRASRAIGEEPYRRATTAAEMHRDSAKSSSQFFSENTLARMLNVRIPT